MTELTIMTDRIGYLQIDRADHVATITIDRPAKLNTMDRSFYAHLTDALKLLENDGRTRVAIITGAGDRAFSAGGDIGSFADTVGFSSLQAYQEEAMAGFAVLEFSPLTTIAAVNGYAFGGGCELTLACDITMVSERAIFAMPEAALGLVPGYGVIRAPDVIGRQMTKLMIAAAERIDAARAVEIGLAQIIVQHSELLKQAQALALRISKNSPLAIRTGKRIVNGDCAKEGYDYSIAALLTLQCAPDRVEGVAAFMEKRRPIFAT